MTRSYFGQFPDDPYYMTAEEEEALEHRPECPPESGCEVCYPKIEADHADGVRRE